MLQPPYQTGPDGQIIMFVNRTANYVTAPLDAAIFGGFLWVALRRWIDVNAAGFVAATMAGGLAAWAILLHLVWEVIPESDPGASALSGLLMGAVIGAAQWAVLRSRTARASWWIVAMSAGFGGRGMMWEVFEALDAPSIAQDGGGALALAALSGLVLRGTVMRRPAGAALRTKAS